jgi:C-terminal processing protease CtpA/Prc
LPSFGKAAAPIPESPPPAAAAVGRQATAHEVRHEVRREVDQLRTVLLNRNSSKDGAQQTGIGINFGRVCQEASGPCKILSVASAGTAFESGLIQAGDLLFKVNGASVVDLNAEQITALILGKPSSPIQLTISTTSSPPVTNPELPRHGDPPQSPPMV